MDDKQGSDGFDRRLRVREVHLIHRFSLIRPNKEFTPSLLALRLLSFLSYGPPLHSPSSPYITPPSFCYIGLCSIVPSFSLSRFFQQIIQCKTMSMGPRLAPFQAFTCLLRNEKRYHRPSPILSPHINYSNLFHTSPIFIAPVSDTQKKSKIRRWS